jgi:hypothetical protein
MRIITAMLLIGYLAQANAQVTLLTTSHQVKHGEVFTADVKVIGFKDIIGTQFSIVWDSTLLQLIGVENFGLQGVRNDRFGLFNGIVRFAWIDDQLSGITVNDSTTIFSIKFRAAFKNASTQLRFTDQPVKIEVLDKAEKTLNVNTLDGTVLVGETITATENWFNDNSKVELLSNYPNPFKDITRITVMATEAQYAELKLWTQEGKHIKTYSLTLLSGENYLEIDSNIFPASGVYYYQLLTKNYATTKKLSVLRE